jgi:hypothetical protein
MNPPAGGGDFLIDPTREIELCLSYMNITLDGYIKFVKWFPLIILFALLLWVNISPKTFRNYSASRGFKNSLAIVSVVVFVLAFFFIYLIGKQGW